MNPITVLCGQCVLDTFPTIDEALCWAEEQAIAIWQEWHCAEAFVSLTPLRGQWLAFFSFSAS
jgi:hypothetical protein